MVRQRKKLTPEPPPSQSSSSGDSMPGISGSSGSSGGPPSAWSARAQWMFFALASGACAAFNGVFAKLYVFFSLSFSFFLFTLSIILAS